MAPTGEQVWHAAMKSDLARPARDILLAMAALSNGSSTVMTSERELATLTPWSRSTVWAHLRRLEELGWLLRLASSPTVFEFDIPAAAATG